jgi:L-lactate dehydrogenase complex protein LldG
MSTPASPSANAASSREKILGRVKAALQPIKDRAALPDYDTGLVVTLPAGADLWTHFCRKLKGVNGLALESVDALKAHLVSRGVTLAYCDPALRESVAARLAPEIAVEFSFDRARVDAYGAGITRACGAIAETGSIVINDAATSSRLGALAPWIHVAVLAAPAVLWPDIPLALAQLGPDPNTIWITGPSKTADIEGILIEGVHGPGEQICLKL